MLDPRVTVADVVHLLAEPDTYLSQSLGHLRREVKHTPASQLTIGRRGNGSYPNYRVDVPLLISFGDNDEEIPTVIDAPQIVYSGRTHKILTDPEQVKNENWSRASISFKDLEALLAQHRKIKV